MNADEDKSEQTQAELPSAGRPTAASAALVLVSTPIGNLKDLSPRAVATLGEVAAILCEDTRTSGHLLRAHGISTRLVALHDFNEEARIPGVIARMAAGERFALISDAGTPLVSDPGYRLVRAAIEAGLLVSGVPGPNAAVFALTLSGLPPNPFLFVGFLPAKAGARQAELARLRALEAAGLAASLVFYEAPHRLAEFCADAAAAFGGRPAAVCRELSKHFEEVRRGTLPELAAYYGANQARGEITVVIGPAPVEAVGEAALDEVLRAAMGRMSLKDAVEAAAGATGVARKLVYARALGLKDQG
jgi:16S rRNA (cytidine1402-2'-O)-methyltransferase